MSETSNSSVLDAVLERDQFLGKNRCIVCGLSSEDILEHCYIIGDKQTWLDLKHRNCIPPEAKDSPQNEPHNLMLMCPNHCISFEKGSFIIRYIQKACRFVFVNCTTFSCHSEFHQKAVALTIDDGPYPALFQAYEEGVLQHCSITPVISNDESNFAWQDWIEADGVFDEASHTFRRSH